MERDVCKKGQLEFFWDDQPPVNEADGPVEETDKNFHWGCDKRKIVLSTKETQGRRQVGEGAKKECQGSKNEGNNGKVLKMPTIGIIDNCRIVHQPLVR